MQPLAISDKDGEDSTEAWHCVVRREEKPITFEGELRRTATDYNPCPAVYPTCLRGIEIWAATLKGWRWVMAATSVKNHTRRCHASRNPRCDSVRDGSARLGWTIGRVIHPASPFGVFGPVFEMGCPHRDGAAKESAPWQR